MYPYEFTYRRATSIAEAEAMFDSFEDPAFLSGGHTLVPAMKNRLSRPDALIDLRGIPELHGITRNGDRLDIGAATPHALVAASDVVRAAIPALAGMAGTIADPQVRSQGTIGGSVANNDPAADYPAASLGLGARLITNRREMEADEFFQGLFATALDRGEILMRVSCPIPESAGYAKLCNKASRYAMAAAFVAQTAAGARVAVTGAGSEGVFRWSDAEAALTQDFSAAALAGHLPDADDMASDMHGDAEYRANLVAQMTLRAVACMGGIDVR